MTKPNELELRRLMKFVETHREKAGQLPTLKDMENAGFSPELIAAAEKQKRIEKFYVTLTNGAVVKGYKLRPKD